jgi:hypothetical protein
MAAAQFGLRLEEFAAWSSFCDRLAVIGQHLLIQCPTKPTNKEWLGLYTSQADTIPLWVM